MNYKHIAIIALVFMLALIVPASAVWSNGNWVADDKKDEYFGNAEVKYDPTTGVTSKYSAPADTNLMTYQGMVVGHLRSGGAQDGGARFLFHRVGAPENQTLAQNFGPDGQYTGYLAPGEYDVILPQGTGSACGVYSDDWGYVGNPHEERTTITVVAGQKAYFDFIGNSIPSYGSTCTPTISVTEAKYCWEGYTIHHDAYTEYFGDYEKDGFGPGTHYDYVGSNAADYDVTFEYRAPTWHGWHWDHHGDYSSSGSHYVYVGHDNGDYDVDHTHNAGHIHHPSYDEYISGDCVDVTTDVQSIVGSGASSFQMIFDNAPNPGGIFAADGSTLLKAIVDPSVGHVKTATIKYNTGCGSSVKTVSKEERQIITLI